MYGSLSKVDFSLKTTKLDDKTLGPKDLTLMSQKKIKKPKVDEEVAVENWNVFQLVRGCSTHLRSLPSGGLLGIFPPKIPHEIQELYGIIFSSKNKDSLASCDLPCLGNTPVRYLIYYVSMAFR